ncbi:MAG: M66 family metalloprotease [Polyangiales bacterium]
MRISARQTVTLLSLLAGCVGEVGQSEELQTATGVRVDDEQRAVAQAPGVDAGASADANACPAGQQRAPAAGLRIREVALYQTVKLPLYQNNAWVAPTSRVVPLIQNRTALARIFVDTLAGYRARPLRGTLTLQNGTTSTVLTSDRTLSAASTDADLNSTFTFNVNGAQIGPSTQVTFAVEEPQCGSTAAAVAGTRVPATGTQALTATATGKLRVVIVPISVGGLLPSTTPQDLADIKAALYAYYPVPSVEVSVRSQPLQVAGTMAGQNNAAWSNTLNQVMRTRSADRVDSDVYYFGLVRPAATFATYCRTGCILGIAPQTTRVQASAQVGLGAAFTESKLQNHETIVHELGHAHGRGHAPCVQGGRIAGVDQRFPDKSGAIATWGWDNRNNTLYPPTHKDVMGYCRPNWISAYTYVELAKRAQAVNKAAYVFAGINPVRWHSLIAYGDGTARWGGEIETGLIGGDTEPADVLDASGRVIKQVDVVRMELSHSSDQFFYIPEPGADWAAVALHDRKLELSQVAAPL